MLENKLQEYLGLSSDQIAEIIPYFKKKEYDKGQHITRVGQVYDELSYIQSGAVRIYGNRGKKEVTQWVSVEDEFITDLTSLLFGGRSHRHMEALEHTVIMSISGEDYRLIQEKVPGWSKIEQRLIAGCFITLENRIFDQISMTAEERYDHFYEIRGAALSRVPQQYIASMLGMTPETFSRIRAKKIS